MAKGRTPSTARALASLVRNYQRLQRSLLDTRGETPEAAALLQRRQEIRRELQELRARIQAARKGAPARSAADDPALAALRDSILRMSRILALPVDLD
ncbi:MAG: hypothetical protein EYC70_01555 [Planctomycetota bacterium]|nr:MAG: hypothetical protein EYC70_01555 [Planctomycetota bacterium]